MIAVVAWVGGIWCGLAVIVALALGRVIRLGQCPLCDPTAAGTPGTP